MNRDLSPEWDLELDRGQMTEIVTHAMTRLVAFVESLPDQPIDGTREGVDQSAALARSLREHLPDRPTDVHALIDDLFQRVLPISLNTASAGYFAYIPGGGLFHAAVAELITHVANRYVGVWRVAPGLVQLEVNVVRWFCEIVGYPETSLGLLTSGGSMANLSAIIAARRTRLPEDFFDAVLYTSEHTHHSAHKAALLAGFTPRNIQQVPCDARYRLRVDALAAQIAKDRAAGLIPFLVVGSAGTTNTGTVDDLTGLADVAERENVWLHVDAAYGGFFMLTERGRRAMQGIERADSIILDPHKGLFLPYGTGALLVRDQQVLKQAFQSSASYMPPMQEAPDLVDFCDVSPELSRECRGLRVWLPIKMHGIEPFRRNLDEKLDLAHWAADQLRNIPEIEIVAEPELSTLVFRLVRPGLNETQLRALNREFLDRVNARNRVLLMPTMLGDRFVIRICVLSFRTHLDRMQELIEILREEAGAVRGRKNEGGMQSAECRM